MTEDPQLIEAAAEAMVRDCTRYDWDSVGEPTRSLWRDRARAVLSAAFAVRPSSPEPSCAECKDTGRWYGSVGDDAPRERSRCPACARPSSPTPEEPCPACRGRKECEPGESCCICAGTGRCTPAEARTASRAYQSKEGR